MLITEILLIFILGKPPWTAILSVAQSRLFAADAQRFPSICSYTSQYACQYPRHNQNVCFGTLVILRIVFVKQPIKQGQPPDPLLKRCCQVLEALTRTVPGLLEALYLMAKVRFLQGMLSKMLSASYAEMFIVYNRNSGSVLTFMLKGLE